MSGERTEAATPRRREQLRSEGRAPRSAELGLSIGLLAGCLILQSTAGNASTRMQGLLTGTFQVGGVSAPESAQAAWRAAPNATYSAGSGRASR